MSRRRQITTIGDLGAVGYRGGPFSEPLADIGAVTIGDDSDSSGDQPQGSAATVNDNSGDTSQTSTTPSTSTSTTGTTTTAGTNATVVTADAGAAGNLNMRDQPNASGNVVQQLTQGQRVNVTGYGGPVDSTAPFGWDAVSDPATGNSGYASAQYLQLDNGGVQPSSNVQNAIAGGMDTTTMLLIAGGVVVAGGLIWWFMKKGGRL